MNALLPILEGVRETPIEYLLAVVALAAIGLAAFSIHAVLASTKKKDRP